MQLQALPLPCTRFAGILVSKQNRFFSKTSITRPTPGRLLVTLQATENPGSRRKRGALARKPDAQQRSGISSTNIAAAASATAIPATDQPELSSQKHALKALSRHRALVLDSSYRPIDVVNWQRAICMALLDKADVLEYYESTVCSVSAEFFLPAVMRARTYFGGKVGRLGSVALNRRNIFLRDNFRCQYCGRRGTSNLTIDHVIPQCKGGTNTWTNLVTACPPCNTRKGDKSLKQLKWKLLSQPRKPSPWEMNLILAAVGVQSAGSLPPEWANYLVTRNGSLSDLEDLDD